MNANLSHDPYRTNVLEKPAPLTKTEIMKEMLRKPYSVVIVGMGIICLSTICYSILSIISLVFFNLQTWITASVIFVICALAILVISLVSSISYVVYLSLKCEWKSTEMKLLKSSKRIREGVRGRH